MESYLVTSRSSQKSVEEQVATHATCLRLGGGEKIIKGDLTRTRDV